MFVVPVKGPKETSIKRKSYIQLFFVLLIAISDITRLDAKLLVADVRY